MGYRKTKHTIYTVFWPKRRIIKVGYSEKQRWRSFEIRGANTIGLMEFDDISDALAFERACHYGLSRVCRPAFPSSSTASKYLGHGGGGYSECYVLPADLMESEMLDFIDYQLADVHAFGVI